MSEQGAPFLFLKEKEAKELRFDTRFFASLLLSHECATLLHAASESFLVSSFSKEENAPFLFLKEKEVKELRFDTRFFASLLLSRECATLLHAASVSFLVSSFSKEENVPFLFLKEKEAKELRFDTRFFASLLLSHECATLLHAASVSFLVSSFSKEENAPS